MTTQSAAAMEPIVRAAAGVMPRDSVHRRYIDLHSGWSLGNRIPLRF